MARGLLLPRKFLSSVFAWPPLGPCPGHSKLQSAWARVLPGFATSIATHCSRCIRTWRSATACGCSNVGRPDPGAYSPPQRRPSAFDAIKRVNPGRFLSRSPVCAAISSRLKRATAFDERSGAHAAPQRTKAVIEIKRIMLPEAKDATVKIALAGKSGDRERTARPSTSAPEQAVLRRARRLPLQLQPAAETRL